MTLHRRNRHKMNLDHTIRINTAEGIRELHGNEELNEILHLRIDLPEGKILLAKAEISLSCSQEDRIFMNGFQSWSYCPEYRPTDRIRGLKHLPKLLVRVLGLDRYGDHYFLPYPDTPGLTHGVSYCYVRRGDHYRLLASLDERPGYTLFFYDAVLGRMTIRRDCEGIRCKGEYPVFDLYYAEGSEDEVFDGWFKAMGIRPRTQEKIVGYTSWYNRYQKISEQTIRSDLLGCVQVLHRGDLFQIDDGWEPFVGDWLETDKKKFPHGLRPLTEEIHRCGLKAGLWLAPFAAQHGSGLFRDHPDWFYQHDGKPWYCGLNWGGFYALDFDHPQVRDYLKETFHKVFDEWGFDLVKLDFLYAAAPLGSDTETRAGRMIRAMEFLRELCSDKLILGCGVPLMPAFGLVDYCRIGCDVGLDWDGSWLMQQTIRERVSTKHSIGNTIFRRQLSGRAWMNDPDVFILREENTRLTKEEKRALATVNSLFGGVLFCSDDMSSYQPDVRAFYEEMLQNRQAADIHVETGDGIRISYVVNEETKVLEIPEEKCR